MGFAGLALGTSIAALFNAAALLVLLRRRLRGLHGARLLRSFARVLLASLAMGFAVSLTARTVSPWLPGTALTPQIVRLAAAIGVGLAVLALSAWALRIHEFRQGVSMVLRRFPRVRR
jgi:putative peptidoglycan lipid II flippase